MRVKAIVEYDGSNYCGFQLQPNAITVQEVLEKALLTLFKQNIKVIPSGRTDTGVHALGQVIHFDIDGGFDMDKLPYALNALLPGDIGILSTESVSQDFHARYSAKAKTYEYKILMSKIKRPLHLNRYYICPYRLDIGLMKNLAPSLIGEHAFAAFMSTGSSIKDAVRTVSRLDILSDGEEITISITANGFLYNMVRIIVGTLIDIARGRLPQDAISKMLQTGDRNIGGATAPPQGLYLKNVEY